LEGMDRISATVARRELPELLNRVAYSNERLCLTRHGKDVACVVSMEEARLLDLIEERLDVHDALAALEEVRELGAVSWEDLKHELGL
jgi:prevent-host-death family protein